MGTADEGRFGGLKERVRQAAGRVVSERLGREHRDAGEAALPAELGEPVWKSETPLSGQSKADTLVIACSDSRYFPLYKPFLKSLQVEQYDVVAVPGGVQWLALPDILPKHNKVARQVVEYLVSRHGVKRVICIAHEGCGMYKNSEMLGTLAHLATGKKIVDHQLEQLQKAAKALKEAHGVEAELYFAAGRADGVEFHRVQ